MNFGKSLLIAVLSLFAHAAIAQNYDQQCEELKTLARESIVNDDYKTASMYLLKAENTCGSLDKDNWDRLIGCLDAVINTQENDSLKSLYTDSILSAYARQEIAGFYNENDDLRRATYNMQSTVPDVKAADFYFQRGLKSQAASAHESYLIYAFYATYLLFDDAEGEEKLALKTRIISDYLWYSELVHSAEMTPQTQGTLDTYFEYVVQSCEELRPAVQRFIDSLPEEKTVAINRIQGMMGLFEDKYCQNSIEYEALTNEWLKLDTSSIAAKYARARILYKNDPIKLIDYIHMKTDDPELKAKCQYEIAYAQMNAGQYQAAYASGRACTGKYKSDGLFIAAKCVAALANTCGESTFDRKCNYLYAAQLAEEAGQMNAAEMYRASGPSSKDCRNDDRIPVILSCWGVTVYTCR